VLALEVFVPMQSLLGHRLQHVLIVDSICKLNSRLLPSTKVWCTNRRLSLPSCFIRLNQGAARRNVITELSVPIPVSHSLVLHFFRLELLPLLKLGFLPFLEQVSVLFGLLGSFAFIHQTLDAGGHVLLYVCRHVAAIIQLPFHQGSVIKVMLLIQVALDVELEGVFRLLDWVNPGSASDLRVINLSLVYRSLHNDC
jgi:hypothetical protein